MIADAQANVLNAALSLAERADALGKIPKEARNDAIVAAAVQIVASTDDPQLRNRIWWGMKGVGNPRLVQPLLQSLQHDADFNVRRAAAATLGDFLNEPGVKEALRNAQASDASDAVRETARGSVLTDQEQNELALQTLLDETLPARERLRALVPLSRNFGAANPVPLNEEAGRAVFDIGTRAEDPSIRGLAWMLLGSVYEPSFIGPMLDDLANHPAESVRRAAASGLGQYVADRAVRQPWRTRKTIPRRKFASGEWR